MTTPNSTNQTREGRSNVIQFPIRKQVPEIDYEQAKTIQGRYDKGQILWEEQSYDHIDYGRLRGQYWEIRNQDTNQALDFQLIYCEPEIEDNDEKCTEQNGIMILEGKTDELCEGI